MRFVSAALLAAACSEAAPEIIDAGPSWRLQDASEALYAASCPEGASFEAPEDITLTATPVALYKDGIVPDDAAPAVDFVAGFSLTSDDKRFGGLSGLGVTRAGNLIAVSDAGHFVWIGLDEDDRVTPVSAALSDIRLEDGQSRDEKDEVDAEGLAFVDGLAIVSFEQNHRIAAFDLETCGAAARAAPITSFDAEGAPGLSQRVRANSGLEGLALLPNGALAAGLETRVDGAAALSLAPDAGAVRFDHRFVDMGARSLTGLDYLDGGDGTGVLYSVHRSFSVLTGPDIALAATPMAGVDAEMAQTQTLLTLKRPHTVDNFEAIAARRLENGAVRLFVLSDDNYQPIQRTLLLVFETSSED